MRLEEIRKDMLKGKPLEEVLENFNWKEFEDTVAEIFAINGFKIKKNFRFKTSKRYEIDVIAVKDEHVLCVDCKEWGRGRYKKTSLIYAVEKQEKRTKEFRKFLNKNLIARSSIGIKNQSLEPLIVTLFQEDLIKEKEVFIVPVWKLNSFLIEIEKFF